jgi:hypothetical protein
MECLTGLGEGFEEVFVSSQHLALPISGARIITVTSVGRNGDVGCLRGRAELI